MLKFSWNWKTLLVAILAVVLPLTLLIGFELSTNKTRPELQTITVEATQWQIDRPSHFVDLKERIENFYTDNVVSLAMGVEAYKYSIKSYGWANDDGVRLRIHFNATLTADLEASVNLTFRPLDGKAITRSIEKADMVKDNLTVTRMKQFGTNTSEAYILTTTTNSSCSLKTIADWIFNDQGFEEHQLIVVSELTYRNTTVHKRIMLPTVLKIVQDVSDTFDTAKNITAGEHEGCLDCLDYIDVYAVELRNGEVLNITMTPAQDANYNLYLYDPSKLEVANSTQTRNTPESIVYRANQTGTWYIKVKLTGWGGHQSAGIYQLKTQVLAP
jgi:hypothetical protein